MAFVVLLDANVLYPATLRDFLITLALKEKISIDWLLLGMGQHWPPATVTAGASVAAYPGATSTARDSCCSAAASSAG